MDEQLLDLAAAEVVAQSKRAEWERQGLSVEFRYWQPTDKPCAVLRLYTSTSEGELLFWGWRSGVRRGFVASGCFPAA